MRNTLLRIDLENLEQVVVAHEDLETLSVLVPSEGIRNGKLETCTDGTYASMAELKKLYPRRKEAILVANIEEADIATMLGSAVTVLRLRPNIEAIGFVGYNPRYSMESGNYHDGFCPKLPRLRLHPLRLFTVEKCRSLFVGLKLEKFNSPGPEIVQETTERIISSYTRMQLARDRQKSYADLKRYWERVDHIHRRKISTPLHQGLHSRKELCDKPEDKAVLSGGDYNLVF
ncbi:hypothetical protein Tco_1370174 [Tanacetum coccineum]